MIIEWRNKGYRGHLEGLILGIVSHRDILIAKSLGISLQDGRGVHAPMLIKSIKLRLIKQVLTLVHVFEGKVSSMVAVNAPHLIMHEMLVSLSHRSRSKKRLIRFFEAPLGMHFALK